MKVTGVVRDTVSADWYMGQRVSGKPLFSCYFTFEGYNMVDTLISFDNEIGGFSTGAFWTGDLNAITLLPGVHTVKTVEHLAGGNIVNSWNFELTGLGEIVLKPELVTTLTAVTTDVDNGGSVITEGVSHIGVPILLGAAVIAALMIFRR